MLGFAAKKSDATFGPPYAVFNLSKIGLRYFRMGIQASEYSKEKLVVHATAHPNVGWIFSAEGWFNVAIGFWARDNAEINDISSQIRSALGPDDSIVFQSELTSLYGFGNRASTGVGSPMCIVDAAMHQAELAPLEVDYVKLMALDASLTDEKIAEILGIESSRVKEMKESLTERGIMVGIQERINYGGVYYKVFIDSLSRKSDRAADDLIEKLWQDGACVYFERANAKYDIEFEIVLESTSQIKEYLKDFSDYQAVVLLENLYTNLFPLNKTANLKEIGDAFARQEGSVVDLQNSKLWYLNHESAESYLNIYENRKYFEAMSKSELDLFGQVTHFIREKYPAESYSVIDIGSGDGLKGRIFIERLGEKSVKAYFPLDIQPIELAAALKAHEEGGYAKHPTLLTIENMSARFPLKLLPGERQVYIFFGGTYGNYPSEVINAHLKKILSESGALVVAMPLVRETKTDEEIIDSYTAAQLEGVSFGPLAQIGFNKSSFERAAKDPGLILQPRLEKQRLVICYVLKEDVALLGRQFKKGTIFKTTTSWKPTFEQFKAALEKDFNLQLFRNDDFAIAVIEKIA